MTPPFSSQDLGRIFDARTITRGRSLGLAGQVEAVLRQTAPGVPVIQLFADAPAGQPKPSSYLLAAYAAWFPAETVLLCVVDPGVAVEDDSCGHVCFLIVLWCS